MWFRLTTSPPNVWSKTTLLYFYPSTLREERGSSDGKFLLLLLFHTSNLGHCKDNQSRQYGFTDNVILFVKSSGREQPQTLGALAPALARCDLGYRDHTDMTGEFSPTVRNTVVQERGRQRSQHSRLSLSLSRLQRHIFQDTTHNL